MTILHLYISTCNILYKFKLRLDCIDKLDQLEVYKNIIITHNVKLCDTLKNQKVSILNTQVDVMLNTYIVFEISKVNEISHYNNSKCYV